MRGEKRIKAIERELGLLQQELNLKLIGEAAFAKASATLIRELDTLMYKDGKRELAGVEKHLTYLQRRREGLIKNYLVEIAKGKVWKRLADNSLKSNGRSIKEMKKFRTFLYRHMKQLSKTV